MKTDDWIDCLARDAGPVDRTRPLWRLGGALGAAVLISVLASVGVLGVDPQLQLNAPTALKFAYLLALLGGCVRLLWRLGRPGLNPRRAQGGVLGVWLAMGGVALAVLLFAATPAQELLLGQSWTTCPRQVAALALPALLLGLWGMQGLAPTQARAAGLVTGLTAGAIGALGYALHCPEWSPLFVWVWYGLGMLVPAACGWLLGPRLLRW